MIRSNDYRFYRVEAHKNQRPILKNIKEVPIANTGIQPTGKGRYVVYGWFRNEWEVIDWWENNFE